MIVTLIDRAIRIAELAKTAVEAMKSISGKYVFQLKLRHI
jgi:hypothetical protein